MPPATELLQVVQQFASVLLDYAIALAAVGALSMALLELVKKLLDTQARFHATRVTRWIGAATNGDTGKNPAYVQLIQLSTGVTQMEADEAVKRLEQQGSLPLHHAYNPPAAHSLFALGTDKMMAVLQDAADLALASPAAYGELFTFLTQGATQDDIRKWNASFKKSPTSAKANRDVANAYARLRQIAKRKLDGFRIYADARWASGNQLMSNLLGAGIMGVVLVKLSNDGANLPTPVLVVLSLLGGILSPVAKDLMTALRKVKSPSTDATQP